MKGLSTPTGAVATRSPSRFMTYGWVASGGRVVGVAADTPSRTNPESASGNNSASASGLIRCIDVWRNVELRTVHRRHRGSQRDRNGCSKPIGGPFRCYQGRFQVAQPPPKIEIMVQETTMHNATSTRPGVVRR